MPLSVIRAGNDNLFQSAIFSETIATLAGTEIEILATNGAVGAARAAGVGAGLYESAETAMQTNALVARYTPNQDADACRQAYKTWENLLKSARSGHTL